METVEDPPATTDMEVSDSVKNNVTDSKHVNTEISVEVDVCHKSNGDLDINNVEDNQQSVSENSANVAEMNSAPEVEAGQDSIVSEIVEPSSTVENQSEEVTISEVLAEDFPENTEAAVVCSDKKEETVDSEPVESVVEVDGIIETTTDNVAFETEILIETNVNETDNKIEKLDDTNDNNILNELGQNIELSDVLCSSDVNEHMENNNCEQEVFNKEELLDILEGNDVEQNESRKIMAEKFSKDSKHLEAQLAIQQISRLQRQRAKHTRIEKKPKKTIKDNKVTKVAKEDSIVNDLVKDWDDDDNIDDSKKILNDDSEGVNKSEESKVDETPDKANTDKLDISKDNDDTPSINKSSDDSHPQRRFGRVIKKKVIFDPDNPDTFTKTKSNIKKEAPALDKDHSTPLKKVKSEQTTPRSKSKSPVNKLQWKKPPPKNSKQNKRLTEIDKLLMDEGAVNMICQLTPEAPKGKKNMKSKAEFIKKIQSNTPGTKEMKFRERKKETKPGDNEARKIGGGKQRLSLSSSVKSPSVSEDFEAHSADDSIIYRRHSSSSYSSSCMSPRRLSDVEGGNNQSTPHSQNTSIVNSTVVENNESGDVFMAENSSTPATDIMNKSDCLSIKEKLNSKLSQALNKRKREATKVEKPTKIKKVAKPDEVTIEYVNNDKFININIDGKVAEINVSKIGPNYNIQLLEELQGALSTLNSNNEVCVTLISFESGDLCSGLDLSHITKDENGTKYAKDIADAARSLLIALESHKNMICIGVEGKCFGFSLAVAALCDVVLANETAMFSLAEPSGVLLQPGAVVLSSLSLPNNMINDLVVFGGQLSAREAMNAGLVSRTVWSERIQEQVRAVARNIATQPLENVMLKKQLLVTKRKQSTATFLSNIEKELDLLLKYWTSDEGQKILHQLNVA